MTRECVAQQARALGRQIKRAGGLLLVCATLATGLVPSAAAHGDAKSSEVWAAALDVEQCVQVALGQSAQSERARTQVGQHEARLAQVEATMYPKLTAMSFLAPAYTVRGGGFDENPVYRYKSVKDWGPYTNLEARLAQGLYSFGRMTAAKTAARERVHAERARAHQVDQEVAREVRRLYFTRLYVESFRPSLLEARALVESIAAAAASRAGASVGPTQSEVGRLVHGQSELLRRIDQAEEAAHLSLAALRQVMGLDEAAPLQLADARLPMPPTQQVQQEQPASDVPVANAPDGVVGTRLRPGSERPEWAQLAHGQASAVALERAERAAMLPRLALVGQFNAAWTPTRDRDRNPWHYDVYNRLAGGLALVLQLDLDVAQARAKAREAAMVGAELRALERLAETGIPLEIQQAYEGLRRARADWVASQHDVVATRRWFVFAKSAMASGTGEVRDLLEGLVASLEARQAHLGAAMMWWQKMADLAYATGAKTMSVLPKNSN